MEKPKKDQKAEDAYLDEFKRKATVAMDRLDDARRRAETFQDYYDGIQWTDIERKTLEARGQPALVFNHVKPAVNAIIGIVERGKTDPKAWGRGPKDQESAEVATDGLRYVADVSRFNATRRDVLWDFLVWGYAAGIQEIDGDTQEIGLKRIKPEEFFYDPYSRNKDFADARYDGVAKWMDEADLSALYPEQTKEIQLTFDTALGSDTYKDRPRNGWSWVDTKSRRLMVFEMYHRRGADWHKCVFVSGGILEQGPSPFIDGKTGRPRNPIIAESAYVDRDNCRYGVVRDMIGPQDAINKARSKAVHILNVSKLRVDPGLMDVDVMRWEWAKPDGIIEAREGQIEELGDRQLAPAHLELLRDAKDEMRRQSPTPGIVGRSGSSQSGRAILAEQQAGMTEQAPLLAQFDDWTLRVYRGFWDCIKQFWTQPKWVRVTDDEQAPRFVGLNVPQPVVDPMTGQPQIDPTTGQPVQQVQNSPADIDVDIVIDSTPDTAVIQEEQFQRLAELVQAGMPIPPDVLIEASSLPKKRLLLDKLKQAQEQASQQPNQAMQADMQKAQMQTQAKQQELEMQAQADAQSLLRQDEADKRKHERAMQLADRQFQYDMQRMRAQAGVDLQKEETKLVLDTRRRETDLEFAGRSKQLELDWTRNANNGQDEEDDMKIQLDPELQKALATAVYEAKAGVLKAQEQAALVQAAASKQAMDAQAQLPGLLTDAITSLSRVAALQAAPRRLVRDPVTGEKRTEIVMTSNTIN